MFRVKFFLLLLFARGGRPKNAKQSTSFWANLLGIKLDRKNKTAVWYYSQSINYESRVEVFPYSHWLFCNFSIKFDHQKFSDKCYDEGYCRRSILKNANSSHGFYVRCLGSLRAKFEGNPSNFHTLQIRLKKVHSQKNKVVFSASKVL